MPVYDESVSFSASAEVTSQGYITFEEEIVIPIYVGVFAMPVVAVMTSSGSVVLGQDLTLPVDADYFADAVRIFGGGVRLVSAPKPVIPPRPPGVFLPKRDRALLGRMVEDFYKKATSPGVLIDPGLPPTADYDALYNEERIYNEALRRGIRYDVPAFIRAEPHKREYKKYGVSQHRNVQIFFPLDGLKKIGLERVQVGWVFIYLNETYRITETNAGGFTDHHDSHLYQVVFANKARFSSLEKDPELIVSPTKDTFFVPNRDIGFLAEGQAELFKQAFSTLPFFFRDRDSIEISVRSGSPGYDTFYNEEVGEYRIPGVRKDLPAYVLRNPNQWILKRAGLSVSRDIVVYLPLAALGETAIPNYGDCFLYEDEYYLITDQVPQTLHRHAETFVSIMCFGKKLKQSSLELAPLVPESTPPGEGYQKPVGDNDPFAEEQEPVEVDIYGEPVE